MKKSTPTILKFRNAIYRKALHQEDEEGSRIVSREKTIEEIVSILRVLSAQISTPVKSMVAQLAKPNPLARMMIQHRSELYHNAHLMYYLLEDLQMLQKGASQYIDENYPFRSPATRFFVKNEMAIHRGEPAGVEVRPDSPEE